MEQKNDWFGALILNPNETLDSLMEAGFNSENTMMYDKDSYLKSAIVVDKFKKEDGTFDNTAYDKFYDSALRTYNKLVTIDLTDKASTSVDWSYFNPKKEGTGTLPTFGIEKVSNPYQKSKGVSSLFGEGKAKLSVAEAAQNNFVRDSQGNKLNFTPNDDDKRGLLGFWGNKPMYLAKWEEDGFHKDKDGNQIEHYAGQPKLDIDGSPYYQELGENETTLGKKFLSWSDTLTIDGSVANKYDFFDSDGLDKSVAGSVTKLVATALPLFIPYVGGVYAAAIVGANLADAGATLGKVGLELIDSEANKSDLWKMLNNFSAYSKTYVTDRTVSEKGSESFWNVEQISNLVSDVVSQGFQQRIVAKGTLQALSSMGYNATGMNIQKKLIAEYGETYLKKYGKKLSQAFIDGDVAPEITLLGGKEFAKAVAKRETSNKLARNISSAYMALTQTKHVSDAMQKSNFSPEYTAGANLLAFLGYTWIMNSPIGAVALKGMGLDKFGKEVNKYVVQAVKDRTGTELNKITTPAGKLNWIKANFIKFKDTVSKHMEASEFIDSAVKEGAEEVSEELLQDAIMNGATALSWSLKQLGFQGDKGSFNYLDSNPLERYLTSFIGGAIGGPINTGINLATDSNFRKQYKESRKNLNENIDLIDLLRNYGSEKLKNELSKYEDKKLLSTVLSNVIDENNDGVYLPASNANKSQNAEFFDTLKNYIDFWDKVINEENADMSNDELINEAMIKDMRISVLKQANLGSDFIKHFNTQLLKLGNAKMEYNRLYYSTPDSEKANNPKLKELATTIENLKTEVQKIRSGLYADDFIDRSVFKLSRNLGIALYTPDIYVYASSRNKNYNSLDEKEKAEMDAEYAEFLKNNSNDSDLAYEVYKRARDLVQPEITNIVEGNDNKLDYLRDLNKVLDELQKEIPIEGIDELDEETLATEIKSKRNGKSNDVIISENSKLNQRENVLSEEEKEQLVNDFLGEQVRQEYLNKASQSYMKYTNLGLDPRFFGDLNRLQKVIEVLQKIKTEHAFIDEFTASKVNNIINLLNNKNFSLLNIIKNYLISFESNGEVINDKFTIENSVDSLTFINTLKNIKDSEGNIVEDLPDVQEMEFTIVANDANSFIANVVFYTEMGEFNVDIPIDDFIILLNNLIGVDADITSFTDFNNSNNEIIQRLKSKQSDDDKLLLKQTVDTIKNATDLLKNENNIISNLIANLSTATYGENVVDTYNLLLKSLTSGKSFADFLINDLEHKEHLGVLLNTISLLESILEFSISETEGNNALLINSIDVINSHRQEVGKNLLQSISNENAELIFRQLNEIKAAAQTMLAITQANESGKIKENKVIHAKGLVTWIEMFSKIDVEINGVNFFDYKNLEYSEETSQAKQKALNEQDLSSKELQLLENLLMDIKNYYYNKFKNSTEEDKKTLIENIAKINVFGSIGTLLNRSISYNTLDSGTKINYLLTSLLTNPEEFRGDFTSVISSEEFNNIVPLYPQTVTIEEAIATFEGKSYINLYLEEIAKNFPKESQNFSIQNSFFFPGSAGSGKTTVGARIIHNILSKRFPNYKFMTYAHKADTSSNLAKVLNISDTFFNSNIYNQWFSDEVIEEINKFKKEFDGGKIDYETVNKKVIELISKIDPSKVFDGIIMIDEYTHISNFEHKLLSSIPGIFIFNFGDIKQEGYKGSLGAGGNAVAFSGIALDISVRSNNNHKKDNMTKISGIIDAMLNEVEKHKNGKGNISNLSNVLSVLSKEGILKYSEKNGVFQGEKIVDSINNEEIEEYIKHVEDGKKLAYIYDGNLDTKIANLINEYPNKFIAIKSDEVQGSEYDYTIIDVKLPSLDKTAEPSQILEYVKKLYTLISRSKDGSIIIKSKDSIPLGKSKKFLSYSTNTFDQKEIDEYKNFLSSVYEIFNTKSDKPVTTSPVSEPEFGIGIPSVEFTTNPEGLIKELDNEVIVDSNKQMTLYQSHIMYNVGNGSNRNLGRWQDNKHKKGFELLKNLILRSNIEITTLLNSPNPNVQNKLSLLYEMFVDLGYSNPQDINTSILNAELFIKKEAYDPAIHSNELPNKLKADEEFKKGSDFYRLFYKIPIKGTNEFWEVDLGVITDPKKLMDKDKANLSKTTLTKLQTLADANIDQEFKINKDLFNIRFNETKIIRGSNNNKAYNYDNNSLPKFLEENPWANLYEISYVLNANVKNSEVSAVKGNPIILGSRDMFLDPSTFLSLLQNRIKGNHESVVAFNPSRHGNNFDIYMKKWFSMYRDINNKKSINFKSVVGIRQPSLIRRQAKIFLEFLTAYKTDPNSVLEAIKPNYGNGDLNSKQTNALNVDIANYTAIVQSWDSEILDKNLKLLQDIYKEWDDKIATFSDKFATSKDTLYNLNYKGSSATEKYIKSLDIKGRIAAIKVKLADIEALKSEISETLSTKSRKVSSTVVDLVVADLNNLIELYNNFTGLSEDSDFYTEGVTNLKNALSNLVNEDPNNTSGFTNLSGNLIDWLFSKGYAVDFMGGTMLLHSLFKILSKNPEATSLFSILIDNSNQYKDGIWNTGVFKDDVINGIYKSNNTLDDFYFNSYIAPPNAFLDWNSIEFDNEASEATTDTDSKNNDVNSLNTEDFEVSLQSNNSEITPEYIIEQLMNKFNNSKTNQGIKEFIIGEVLISNTSKGNVPLIVLSSPDGKFNVYEITKSNLTELANIKSLKQADESTKSTFLKQIDTASLSVVDNTLILTDSITNSSITITDNEIHFQESASPNLETETKITPESEIKEKVERELIQEFMNDPISDDFIDNVMSDLFSAGIESVDGDLGKLIVNVKISNIEGKFRKATRARIKKVLTKISSEINIENNDFNNRC